MYRPRPPYRPAVGHFLPDHRLAVPSLFEPCNPPYARTTAGTSTTQNDCRWAPTDPQQQCGGRSSISSAEGRTQPPARTAFGVNPIPNIITPSHPAPAGSGGVARGAPALYLHAAILQQRRAACGNNYGALVAISARHSRPAPWGDGRPAPLTPPPRRVRPGSDNGSQQPLPNEPDRAPPSADRARPSADRTGGKFSLVLS